MLGPEWHEEKIDRHLIAANMAPFGISFLDDALVGIFPNDLILVGARTGRGKTEFATTVAHEASKKQRRVVFFALEADRWEIQRRMKYRALASTFAQHFGVDHPSWPRYSEWLAQGSVPEWEALEKDVEHELNLETSELEIRYAGERYTVDKFEKDFAAIPDDVSLIIIDHLHYFDFGGREYEELPRAIHMIRDRALQQGKPVMLLAHLRKGTRDGAETLPSLDDFHGHSDLVKVATNVILMAPAPDDQAKGLGVFPTYFHIAKSRRASENLPWVGVLGFDRAKNSYNPNYLIARHRGKEAPELAGADVIPKWFQRARRQYYAGG